MRTRLLFPTLLAMTAAAAPPVAVAAPAVAHGNVQLVVETDRGLFHTIRHANGTWDGFGQLSGPVYSTSVPVLFTAAVNGEDHVLMDYATAHPPVHSIVHDVRRTDGTWTWSSAPEFAGSSLLAAAGVSGALHVERVRNPALGESDSTLVDAVQQADGTWTQSAALPVEGSMMSMAATGAGGNLRVLMIAYNGTTLVQVDRHPDGSWSPVRRTVFTTDHGNTVAAVAAVAKVGGDLQAVVIGSGLFHSILHPNGVWDRFRSVDAVAGTPPGGVTGIAVAASSGSLQLVVRANSGGIYHTVRRPDGSWQRFADVKPETGDPGHVSLLGLAGD